MIEVEDFLREIIKLSCEIFVFFFIFKCIPNPIRQILHLPEHVVQKLIDEFDPEEIVDQNYTHDIQIYEECKYELVDHDFMNLKTDGVDITSKIIEQYGVGTCGPRGFYGTLDLHLEIEKIISENFGMEETVLYSNAFTCLNTVISCFCKRHDIIYYHQYCNEAILRGISVTKATTVQFKDLEDLETKVKRYHNAKRRNCIIVEGIFKNTGEIIDLPTLIAIKKKYKLRIIIDESLSFPILGAQGISSYFHTDPEEIDILVGSLADTICSNGAFVASKFDIAYYQRLNAAAYCFSASMPAFLTKIAIENLKKPFEQKKLSLLTKFFTENFKNQHFRVASDKDLPFVILRLVENSQISSEDLRAIKNGLLRRSIRVGVTEWPYHGFKICFKLGLNEEDLKEIINAMSEEIGNVLS